MVEYVALEKSIYMTVHSRPFRSSPSKPMRAHRGVLKKEAEQAVLEMNVSYTLAGEEPQNT